MKIPKRVAFTIFGIDIYYYGIIMTIAIVACVIVACLYCKRKKLDTGMPIEIFLAVVPLGIIFARLFSVLFEDNLTIADYFDFRSGGMSIMGAIVGGIIGIVIYMLIKKRSFLELADIVTSVLLLGQAIGRWGNFFNSELYGKEVTSPALQFFPYAVLVGNQWYEALFFYESVLNLIGFILISVLYFKANTKGLTSGAYLVYYGVVRVILETRRQPQFVLKLWGIKVSLLLSVVMIVAGVVLLAVVISKSVIAKRKNKALGANS